MLRQLILLLCLSVFITAWGAGARPAIAGSSSLNPQNHMSWQSIGPTPPTILAVTRGGEFFVSLPPLSLEGPKNATRTS
jgi:hypothetical protein